MPGAEKSAAGLIMRACGGRKPEPVINRVGPHHFGEVPMTSPLTSPIADEAAMNVEATKAMGFSFSPPDGKPVGGNSFI